MAVWCNLTVAQQAAIRLEHGAGNRIDRAIPSTNILSTQTSTTGVSG